VTNEQHYDVIIIGAGPAGLAAALDAARARRRTLLLERGVTGGQIALTALIENYPGIEEVDGFELGQTMQRQAEKYGMEVARRGHVSGATTCTSSHRRATTAPSAHRLSSADLTVSACPVSRLTGKGVSYCATCDAAFFKDQVVAVVGGGDSALDEGLFVTRYASKVHVIHRRDELRASKILQERAFANAKMDFIWNTVVEQIEGSDAVERVKLKNVVTGEESELDLSAVFIFIGHHPNTEYLRGYLKMDPGGHIYVNDWMETDVPGIFAAGDVRVSAAAGRLVHRRRRHRRYRADLFPHRHLPGIAGRHAQPAPPAAKS
jgi:thioredoxin reductase (NADPH)